MFLDGIKSTPGRMVLGVRRKFKRKQRQYSLNTENTSKKGPVSSEKKENSRCSLGQRHIVVILGFFNCFFINGNRSLVSVTIVAMVKHPQLYESSHSNNSESSCPYPTISSKPIKGPTYQGEFDWDTKMQGYILGVTFGGYLFTQLPGGTLSDAIGSKPLLVACNIVVGLLTIISPFAARWNVYAMLVIQFLRSTFQGFIIPATYRMITNWCPRNERGPLSTLMICGFGFGVVVMGIINGRLCDLPHLGWPSAYYLWGLATLGLSAAFAFLLHEHPRNHPTITEAELKYITDGQEVDLSEKKPPTPWKKILISTTSHAYFFGLFGHYWSIAYFLIVHPTFMGTVLHFSMTENGLSSCGPVLMKPIGGVVASILSSWLTKKNYMGFDKLRKGFTFLGAFGFAFCMLGMSVAGCNATIGILFFSISLFSSGLALCGVMIAGMDMAPVHAGSLMGISCTLAGLSTLLIPVLTGFITTHETLAEWKSVFWISSAIVALSGIVYVVFGSAEVQSWNYPDGKIPEKDVDVNGKQMIQNQSPDV